MAIMKRLALLAASAVLCGQPAAAQDAPASPVYPIRLQAAQATVGFVFPPGTYARLMQQMMGSAMDQVMDSVGKLALRDIVAIGGKSPNELAAMGDGTLNEMLAILDPAHEERMRISMQVMSEEMTVLMADFEPAFRTGLARAYAKRFTTRQLLELNRFFQTPTGAVYAAESMVIMADPEVMKTMAEVMPEMVKHMPAIARKLESASAGLPAPRKMTDLSAAEKQRLADLLGVPVRDLGKAMR